MRWLWLLLLMLALAAIAADDLAAEYDAFGWDPKPRQYCAYEVEIVQTGEVYKVTWSQEGMRLYDGVGVVMNGRLCVGYAGPVGYGVSVYKIGDGGDMEGLWAWPGHLALGWENLHPREGGGGGASDD